MVSRIRRFSWYKNVILHTWNDEKEDFDILCESTVTDFEKDIPKDFWQREILEMNPGTLDGEACIVIDLEKDEWREKYDMARFDKRSNRET